MIPALLILDILIVKTMGQRYPYGIHMGLAQSSGAKRPQKMQPLVGKPPILGVENIAP